MHNLSMENLRLYELNDYTEKEILSGLAGYLQALSDDPSGIYRLAKLLPILKKRMQHAEIGNVNY